jgi:hypothetical protein
MSERRFTEDEALVPVARLFPWARARQEQMAPVASRVGRFFTTR